jgi:hypothetical protein
MSLLGTAFVTILILFTMYRIGKRTVIGQEGNSIFTKLENPVALAPMAKKKRFLGYLWAVLPSANTPNPYFVKVAKKAR